MWRRRASGRADKNTARPVEYWQATVERMLGFVGSSDSETLAAWVELLSKAFDGKPKEGRFISYRLPTRGHVHA